MGPLETFCCPGCGETYRRRDYSAHLAQRPEERQVVFERFVADGEGEVAPDDRCSGAAEIVPLMDPEETGRFGIKATGCGEPVLRCACTGSFCSEHNFACTSCGRFACLRHRWSGRCPTCAQGTRAKPVKVEKYDVFSKQRSTFVRKYRRTKEVAPWDALLCDDDEGSR